jgi:hypothetical protein
MLSHQRLDSRDRFSSFRMLQFVDLPIEFVLLIEKFLKACCHGLLSLSEGSDLNTFGESAPDRDVRSSENHEVVHSYCRLVEYILSGELRSKYFNLWSLATTVFQPSNT